MSVKADAHIACRAHAAPMSFPCHAVPLIHTCHAAPLPFSDSAVSFVKVRVVAGNNRTASPKDRVFCSVLLPLCTVVGMDRCEQDWYASDNNNTLPGTPCGIRKRPNGGKYPTGCLSTAVLCRGLQKNVMVRAGHGRGIGMAWQV